MSRAAGLSGPISSCSPASPSPAAPLTTPHATPYPAPTPRPGEPQALRLLGHSGRGVSIAPPPKKVPKPEQTGGQNTVYKLILPCHILLKITFGSLGLWLVTEMLNKIYVSSELCRKLYKRLESYCLQGGYEH